MLSALAERGSVVHKCVLAAPQHATKKEWAAAMDELGIEFIPVDRRTGGSKDPNDIAIAMEAARLASAGEVGTVAVAVSDEDFLHLAGRLRDWGCKAIAVFDSKSGKSLASAFEESGAEVVRYAAPRGTSGARGPKMKAVLLSSGEGRVERMEGTEDMDAVGDDDAIEEHLLGTKYLTSAGAPQIPAIARYYVANGLGPLTVWPPQLPRAQFHAEVLEGALPTAPCEDPGDLVYVFPYSKGNNSKSSISKYGTKTAAQALSAGGPFMCKESAHLAEDVLRRLGYLDDCYNTDLNEVIDTFTSATANRRAIDQLGLDVPRFSSVHSKKAAIHTALTSGKAHGSWQVAPRDSPLRQILLTSGYISARDCSVDEVWEASKSYAREHSIPVGKTYNVLVRRICSSLNDDPSRRSEQRL